MRNLITAHRGVLAVRSETVPDLPLACSEFDAFGDTMICTFGPNEEFKSVEIQKINKGGQVKIFASWEVPEGEEGEAKSKPLIKVLSSKYFSDSDNVVLVLSNGDIINVQGSSYEGGEGDGEAIIEIVGSIDELVSDACWSPDEEILSIVTKKSLLMLSRVFESIAEVNIEVDDLKISKHVSVGWGKKETQFEGKGAKALRDPTMPAKVDLGVVVEGDDGSESRISWRGDGEFVSISTVDEVVVGEGEGASSIARRTIRVYGRDGTLNSVSEPVDYQEKEISWRPSGNLIAGVQNKSGQGRPGQDLIFFERNGLRRGEFSLRRVDSSVESDVGAFSAQVKGLDWNIDSDVLAVLFDDNTIQLWTSSNYYWHLKQEILSRSNDVSQQSIKWIKWHPEKPLSLLICYELLSGCEYRLETHTFIWSLISGPSYRPNDYGTNVVLDGSNIKITPLKVANTPPPMAFREFSIDKNEVVLNVAVNNSNDQFAILTKSRVLIAEWDLTSDLRLVKAPRVIKQIPLLTVLPDDTVPKQVSFLDNLVAIVVDEVVGSTLVVLELLEEVVEGGDEGEEGEDDEVARENGIETTSLEFSVATVHNIIPDIFLLKTQADSKSFVFETVDGKLHRLSPLNLEIIDSNLPSFPERCISFEVDGGKDDIATAYGLSSKGKLYANRKQIASSVTSLAISESHVIFTTAQHCLKFCHLHSNVDKIIVPADEDQQSDERCRAIERGSLIVSVIPSKTALILQAPRGNLETIHPRIMVLSEVRKNIDQLRFDLAFKSCRVHRIDLNLLHDYSPETFYNNLDLFVEQLNEIEYIDLFLSGLKESDVSETMYKATIKESEENIETVDGTPIPQSVSLVTPNATPAPGVAITTAPTAPTTPTTPTKVSKINRICDSILTVLDTPKNRSKYLQSILTAHACKSPPDLESALILIKDLLPKKGSGDSTAIAETAIQHLCFLQDVELLYRTALGLYDLELTLLVAQQSQKDPKEYLPFLQNIQLQTPLRGKFLVDTHLKRYTKALNNLSLLGEEAFDELLDYVVEHNLFKDALDIYKYSSDKQDKIYELYASYLHGQTNYSEAALIYENLGKYEDALDLYQLAGDWNESLSILTQHRTLFDEEKLKDVAQHLAELTYDNHQYKAAATINMDYLNEHQEAIRILCKGYFYNDAIRLCTLHNRPEYLESTVDPGLLEGFGQISELISDCKSQIKSQVNRIRELRIKKQTDPLGFFGGGEDDDTPDNVSIAPTESSTAPSFFTRYTGKTAGTAQTGASRRTAKNKRREERKRARGKKGSVYEEEYLINSMGRLIDRLEETKPDAIHLIEGLLRRKMRSHAYQIQKMFIEVLANVSEVAEEIFTLSEKDRERYDEDGNIYFIEPKPLPTINPFPIKQLLDY